jgi:hypothetical protein
MRLRTRHRSADPATRQAQAEPGHLGTTYCRPSANGGDSSRIGHSRQFVLEVTVSL